MLSFRVIAAITAVSVSTSAIASPLMMYPVQSGSETARFRQGVPTLDLETPSGAIQITPLPLDHGSLAFGVGFYNKSAATVNFGIENVSASVDGQPLQVFTREELEKKAKNRAMWAQIAVGLAAAGAAYAASTAYTTQTARSTTFTPFGTFHNVTQWQDNTIGVLGASAATAGGVAGIVGIQNRLDYTLEHLANDTLQTTTVDPNASYGGRIVIAKAQIAKPPYDVRVVFRVGDADYPFVFRVTPSGKNLPAAYTVAATSVLPTAPASSPVIQPAVVTTTGPAAAPAAVGQQTVAAAPGVASVTTVPSSPSASPTDVNKPVGPTQVVPPPAVVTTAAPLTKS